jgi:hypothetical protein
MKLLYESGLAQTVLDIAAVSLKGIAGSLKILLEQFKLGLILLFCVRDSGIDLGLIGSITIALDLLLGLCDNVGFLGLVKGDALDLYLIKLNAVVYKVVEYVVGILLAVDDAVLEVGLVHIG